MKLYQICDGDQFKTWNKRKEYIDYRGKHYIVSRCVDYERTNVFSTRKQALCLDMLKKGMEVEDIAKILSVDVINITDFLNMSCNIHKEELTPSATGSNDYESRPDLYEIDSLRQDIKNGKVQNGTVKIEERYLSLCGKEFDYSKYYYHSDSVNACKPKPNNYPPIKNVNTGEIFDNLQEANKSVGAKKFSNSILRCCKGLIKQAYNCKWEFVTDND